MNNRKSASNGLKTAGNAKGAKIVVIGGGTGLGTILRGLKEVTDNLTAIVTVADDGGSSGRLRRDFGILPPGDIRNCLVAMADLEPLMEQLMQYRFGGTSDLEGHNFGNLFLTAMTDVTGDFQTAIRESSKVLAVRGQVLPATLEDVQLVAELEDGRLVTGESQIPKARVAIKRIRLQPEKCHSVPAALGAIIGADLVVLGPGSLYTSIIPNLLVEELTAALRKTTAPKVYVCNAMTQPGETDNYTASDHLQAIIDHTGGGLIDWALVNTEIISPEILERYAEEGAQPVWPDCDRIKSMGIEPLGYEMILKSKLIRHDAQKLAWILNSLAKSQKNPFSFLGDLRRRWFFFTRSVANGMLFFRD